MPQYSTINTATAKATANNKALRKTVQNYLNSPKNGWSGKCETVLLLNDGRIAVGIVGVGKLAQIVRHLDPVAETLVEKYLTAPLTQWVADEFNVEANDLKLIVKVENYFDLI